VKKNHLFAVRISYTCVHEPNEIGFAYSLTNDDNDDDNNNNNNYKHYRDNILRVNNACRYASVALWVIYSATLFFSALWSTTIILHNCRRQRAHEHCNNHCGVYAWLLWVWAPETSFQGVNFKRSMRRRFLNLNMGRPTLYKLTSS